MKLRKNIFLILAVFSICAVPLLTGAVMSGGTYTIESDVIDTISGGYQNGGVYTNEASGGQSCVVGDEDGGGYTNLSGFIPEALDVIAVISNVENITKAKWYQTLAAAVADASNGNVLEVRPGIYNENVDLSRLTNIKLLNSH